MPARVSVPESGVLSLADDRTGNRPAKPIVTIPRKAPSPSSGGAETFGQLVRRLRTSVGEKQEVFGLRFKKSRPYVSNHERGEELVPWFMEQLIKTFPSEDERIRQAYERSLAQLPPTATRRKGTPAQRRIESFMRTGRFQFARRALLEALDDNTLDRRERHWMYEHLATTSTALNEKDKATEALESAIAHAAATDLPDEEISSRDRLATYHQKRAVFQDAQVILDGGLQRHPDAARLWLRKGYVHWYEQNFSSAFAALTTALKYGSPRLTVIFARGQILAEWGNVDAALADINEYLAAPDRRVVNIARIRGARALAWAQMGRWDEAFAEFDAVEDMKLESSWFYYNRGVCHAAAGQQDLAAKYLIRSLQCRSPLINPPRRRKAIALLKEFDVKLDIPELQGKNAEEGDDI